MYGVRYQLAESGPFAECRMSVYTPSFALLLGHVTSSVPAECSFSSGELFRVAVGPFLIMRTQ